MYMYVYTCNVIINQLLILKGKHYCNIQRKKDIRILCGLKLFNNMVQQYVKIISSIITHLLSSFRNKQTPNTQTF